MSDLHTCAGIVEREQNVIVCACVSRNMFEQLGAYFRREVISEINAFANDYHHHIDGRDVVIVEQLIDFLTPLEGQGDNGLGTP